MRLDSREDVDVAAFFACYKNNTEKGRIWIVKTKTLIIRNEAVFKSLDNKFANRASIQKAFALRMLNDKPNLQNPAHFENTHLDFDLTRDDIIYKE